LAPPPKKLGVTHWSSRLLGQHLGVCNGTIATDWREYGGGRWRSETFKLSHDPELTARIRPWSGCPWRRRRSAIVFLAFLKQVARAYPDAELHLVMESYATHKRSAIRDWLAANPRPTAPRPPDHC